MPQTESITSNARHEEQDGEDTLSRTGPRALRDQADKRTLTPQLHILDQDEGIFLGGSKSKVFLRRGTLDGCALTYVAKCHRTRHDADCEAYLYGHEKLLRPLQGVHVQHLLGVSEDPGCTVYCAMTPPHSVGWRHASKAVSKGIQDEIVLAYESIHRQGVLHGHVAFDHILIGDDDAVTIIDFSEARTLNDHTHAGIERCEETDLRREMRKVRHLLGFESTDSHEERHADGTDSPSEALEFEELDALDLSESVEIDNNLKAKGVRFEIPMDKRDSSSELHPRIQRTNPRTDESVAGPSTEHSARKVDTPDTSHPPTKSGSSSPPRVRAPKPIRIYDPTTLNADIDEISPSSCTATHGSSPTPSLPASPPASPPAATATSLTSYKWVDRSKYRGDVPCTEDLFPQDSLVLSEKRVFEVAFHPDTEDNSIWANGRPLKRRKRPPTPFKASEEVPSENTDSQPQFLQTTPWEEDVNPREPPPYRDASSSPAAQDKSHSQPAAEEVDEVVIVITSPTGQRRVWGVPETIATQISKLLDKRTDTQIPHRLAQQTVGSSSVKRKSDEALPGEGTSKLVKKSHSFFSRFFG